MLELDPDKALRAETAPYIASLLGAIVALRFAPGASWGTRAFNVLCAFTLSAFLSPAGAVFFRIEDAKLQTALSVAVAMFGLSLADAIAAGIRDTKFADIITGWLRRKG